MEYVVLGILYALSGFFMKLSDDAIDIDSDKKLAIAAGIICAVTSAIATIMNVGAAYIFIAILIGNFIAFKVDGIHHIITLLIFVVIVLICGVPELSIGILLLCIFSALLDEVGHETIHKITDNKYANLFFEYRFAMKIVVFLLAIFGFFNIVTFIFFILFEACYEFAGIISQDVHFED